MELNRLGWVDTLKGIGILMVVAGHVWEGTPARLIYICHMPLFFFLSGFLFTPRDSFKRLMADKAAPLLIPYLTFVLLLYVPQMAVELARDGFSLSRAVGLAIRGVIGGRAIIGWSGIVWFVTVLFLTQAAINYLVTRCSTKTMTVLMVVFAVAAYVNAIYAPNVWLPLNANVVLMAAPFFWLGYRLKKTDATWPVWASLLGAAASVALVLAGVEIEYDMKYSKYGIPALSFVTAAVSILFLVDVARYVARASMASAFIGWIGSASMVIMYVHKLFIALLRDGAGISNNVVVFLAAASLSCMLAYATKNVGIGQRLVWGMRPAVRQ